MKLAWRQWLVVVVGAGLPIPYAFRLPGSKSGGIAIGIVIWAAAAAVLALTGSTEWARLRRDSVGRMLLAFAIVGALSLPIGVIAYHNFEGLRSFAYQVAIIANFAVGYMVLRKVDDMQLFVRAFVASVGAFGIALALYLLQAGIIGDVHLFHNSGAIRSAVYGWPNYFSVLLAFALVMCLYVFSTTAGFLRGVYAALGIGIGVCLVLTFSKTGWLALVPGLWLIYLRYWGVRRQLLVFGALAAAGVVLFFVTNDSFRIQVFTLDTLRERLQFLAIVLQHANPLILLTGTGSQGVDVLVAPVAQLDLATGVKVGALSSSHDEFLNVLVKQGLFGLILLVAALAAITLRARRLARSADPAVASLFRYWYAAGVVIVVSLFSVDGLHYWPIGAAFWIMAGAVVNLLPEGEEVSLPKAEMIPGSP